ncbi:hypothetical protein D2E26_0783 [Bifidobacterium dolichotidis]|uniref:TPM domain-containing protein n=1 Tax=Bifidobacterium dolichotidis TaxID=2306976 RepID=A0A430FPG9_9BIFI|nr:hypothetical protein D2E26_0783 [Bifidobacterium dolichotidis]
MIARIPAQQANVVNCSGRPQGHLYSRQHSLVFNGAHMLRNSYVVRKCIAVVLSVVLSLAMMIGASLIPSSSSAAFADDPQPAQSSQPAQSDQPAPANDPTATPSPQTNTHEEQSTASYITDTNNLLGDHLGEVSDAIAKTKQKTGVTVRLLYLDSFNTKDSPEKWASILLASLKPAPNTVMLAVAANDGNLVVVVSPNSDEWLRSQKTVDKLSDAALNPIVDADSKNGPDWAKSAIDMMDAIQTAKETSTAHKSVSAGIIVLIVIIVLLIALAVGMIVWRKHHKPRRRSRHSAKAAEERWYQSVAESKKKAHAHRARRKKKAEQEETSETPVKHA